MNNQRGLLAIDKFNEIQVKAASTITRKAEEGVKIEWAKCKSAIENNFLKPISNFVLFNSNHIDRRDDHGYTLLCLAVHYGRVEMVDILLKNGAAPTVQTKESDGKNTPLHIAVNFKFKKISDLLIEAGADEKILNAKGLTPWEGMS
jgi:ankyrin repeat protein